MAYAISKGGVFSKEKVPYLPISSKLPNGNEVTLSAYDPDCDEKALHQILKSIVDDGESYPQDKMESIEDFRAYYTTHDTFVGRINGEIAGAFY